MSFSSQSARASNRPPVLTDPVRYPESASAPMRSKRAIVLLLLTLVLPGSAQIVAGNRKLGRIALCVTFTAWLLIVVCIFLALFKRDVLFGWFTHPVGSVVIMLLLAALALGWAVIFVNTLRIIRPVMLAPGMRALVSGALVILMVACSGTLAYAAWLVNSGRNALGTVFASGPDIPPVDGRYNFLIIGGDAGADRTGRRPDTIIVVSVDANTGDSVTISIPRNLQNAQFSPDSPLRSVYPEGYNCGDACIINSLYTDVTENYANLYPNEQDPGAQAMMDAAGGTLGLTIQGYVLIGTSGFSKLIDALGGVRINSGGWVPMSGEALNNLGDHAPPVGWIPPGVQTLNGDQALWYVRSREWTNDYARSARQQCIQAAILKQMNPATVLSKFNEIASAGAQVIESDIPQQQLGSFLDLAIKARNYPLDRLTIGPPDFDQNFPTYPDFGVIQQRVSDLLANNTGANSSESGPGTAEQDPAQQDQGSQAQQEPNQQNPAPQVPTQPNPAQGSTGPAITQEYLQSLAEAGDEATLISLLANNGQCSPA